MDETEIIEKIDKFFDKEGLDTPSKYFLTKKINEGYWEDILSEEEEETDPLGELGEEEAEETTDETEELSDEIAAPRTIKKKKLSVKKPKVTAKKIELPNEEGEKEEDVTI